MKWMFLLVLAIGTLIVIGGRMAYVQRLPQQLFTPDVTQTILTPPKQALEGTIESSRGTVKKLARLPAIPTVRRWQAGEAKDFATVDATQPILQGEILATERGGRAKVTIDDIWITLEGDTEVEFVNLVYPTILFRHRRGSATYATTTSSFSIRSLHALIELGTGKLLLTTNDQTIDIRLTSGTAKLALVDANNETHVWKLTDSDRATINDGTREVTTTGELLTTNTSMY